MRKLRPEEISLAQGHTAERWNMYDLDLGLAPKSLLFFFFSTLPHNLWHRETWMSEEAHGDTEAELQTQMLMFPSHRGTGCKCHSAYRTFGLDADLHGLQCGTIGSPDLPSFPISPLLLLWRIFRSKVQPFSWGIILSPVTLFSECPSQRRASAKNFSLGVITQFFLAFASPQDGMER